jgi:hypothetical protein
MIEQMPNQNNETTFLVARHSKKTKTPIEGSAVSGEFYQGISEEGEAIVRERTREHVLSVVEQSAPGSVILFAGSSELPRTKSTTRISTNELKNILADKQDEYIILDEKDITGLVDTKTQSTREVVSKLVQDNPGKKIILSYPLFLKELSLVSPETGSRVSEPEWTAGGQKEIPTAYLTELLKRNNNNAIEAVLDWVKNNGQITTELGEVLRGPNPLDTAKGYVTAMKRLEKFSKELFPNRPLTIELTGHSWDIDAFIAYATHNGKLNVDTVQEIAKGDKDTASIISEFEFPVIKMGEQGGSLSYRGKEYQLNSPEFK